MDIQDIRKYHLPTGSPDSDITPETALARVRKEQLTLGVSDSDSDSDTSDKNYEDPKENDPVDANDTQSQDRDDDALERVIRRTSQLIEEGQYAMAPHPETGTPKEKETATKQTPMMEEQLQQ